MLVGSPGGGGTARRGIAIYYNGPTLLAFWKNNKKDQKACLDNLPMPTHTRRNTRWNARLAHNSKNTGLRLSHSVHTECRLQVPRSSEPVFEVHIKASQARPIAVRSSMLGHACAYPLSHCSSSRSLYVSIQQMSITCLLCAKCYVSNCYEVSNYKIKSFKISIYFRYAPSSCHNTRLNPTSSQSPMVQIGC